MIFRRPPQLSAKAQAQRRVDASRAEGKREVLGVARQANAHLSQSVLEQYLLEATTQDVTRGVQAHLRACLNCRNELRSLEALHREFTEQVLPRTLDRVTRQLVKRADAAARDSGEFDGSGSSA